MPGFSAFVGDSFLHEMEIQLGEPSTIRLVVSQEMERPAKLRRVVFEEVAAFQFETGHPSTVLFDIELIELRSFVKRHYDQFSAGKNHNWPFRFTSMDRLPAALAERQLLAVELDSKTGTAGWVLAKRIEIQAVGRDGEFLSLLAAAP